MMAARLGAAREYSRPCRTLPRRDGRIRGAVDDQPATQGRFLSCAGGIVESGRIGADDLAVRGDPGTRLRLERGRMSVCRVYWGSHGCDIPRGHRSRHRCDCSSTGYGWPTRFYGEDLRLRDRVLVGDTQATRVVALACTEPGAVWLAARLLSYLRASSPK